LQFHWTGIFVLYALIALSLGTLQSGKNLYPLYAIFTHLIHFSHPILYSQYGARSSRALISIFLVWFISICVGIPILFGANPLENQVICIKFSG
jgi:hypothetical protein